MSLKLGINIVKKSHVNIENLYDILSQPLWFNHHYNKPTLYIKNWARKGILWVKDLCDKSGFLTFDHLKEMYGIKGTYLDYLHMLNMLPDSWKYTIRHLNNISVSNLLVTDCHLTLLNSAKGSRIFYDTLISNQDLPKVCLRWQHLSLRSI